jgi:hypothetical protein
MHQDLQRLTSELRNEKCPQRVLDEVARRIAAQRANVPAQTFYPRLLATGFITVALVIVCGLLIWHQPQPGPVQRQLAHVPAVSPERAQVIREAEGTLGYIGCILLDAGSHTEKIVLNQAVPHLRNGLVTAREKLLNHIQP